MSVINHNYGYIFCHEPHTGGRAVEQALMQHEGSHNFNGETHISPVKMSDAGWVSPENYNKYTKFRVIRNPYDWLMTGWFVYNKCRDMFFDWAMTGGLGKMTHVPFSLFGPVPTLFWRYYGAVDWGES
jgi:hypothetical protein